MKAHTNTTRRKVTFGDCDPAKIVYYPNYFVWFDQATHDLFESAGLPLQEIEKHHGVLCPIIDAQSGFKSPARWDDEIEIVSEITRWGSRSFTATHRISQVETGVLVAEGKEERVCVRRDPANPDQIRSCDVPAEFLAALGAGKPD